MSSEYISFHFVSFHSIPKAALQDKCSSVKDAVAHPFGKSPHERPKSLLFRESTI